MQAAHLLTQATKSLCRAHFSSWDACAQEGAVPLNAPLHHLRLSTPGALGYGWQQLIVEKASGAAGWDATACRMPASPALLMSCTA